MSAAKSPPVIAIDLLRFACAMLVLGYHFGWAFAAIPEARVAAALPQAASIDLAHAGSIGVELFFVISGMVIARSAVGMRWTGFLRQRALRLVPAAWICATATLAVLVVNGQGDAALAGDWWRSMRFWPIGGQVDGSYWTLGVELSFYLMVTAVVGALGDPRRIERLGWAIGAASASFWIACLTFEPARALMTSQAAVLLLLPHGCLFALGMMIAARPATGFGTTRRCGVVALITVCAVEGAAHISGWRLTGAMLLAETILIAGIAILLAADGLQPLLARRITPGQARAIGLMTYPLYLLHQEIGAVIAGAAMRAGASYWVGAGIAAAIVLVLAALVARFGEPLLRRALARLLDRPRRVAGAAGSGGRSRPPAPATLSGG